MFILAYLKTCNVFDRRMMENRVTGRIVEVLAGLWVKLLTVLHRVQDVVRADSKGWLICGCVLVITVVRSGITYSFGMFVVKLQYTYHKPLAEQSKSPTHQTGARFHKTSFWKVLFFPKTTLKFSFTKSPLTHLSLLNKDFSYNLWRKQIIKHSLKETSLNMM